MYYNNCHYFTSSPLHFHGCPGLDVNGDSDECGECPYRLDNICKALSASEQARSSGAAKSVCPHCGEAEPVLCCEQCGHTFNPPPA